MDALCVALYNAIRRTALTEAKWEVRGKRHGSLLRSKPKLAMHAKLAREKMKGAIRRHNKGGGTRWQKLTCSFHRATVDNEDDASGVIKLKGR